jgi:hypothetical protein
LVCIANIVVAIHTSKRTLLPKAEVAVPLIPLKCTLELGRHIRGHIANPEGIHRRSQPSRAISVMAASTEVRDIRVRSQILRLHEFVQDASIRIDQLDLAIHVRVQAVAHGASSIIQNRTVVGMGI